MLTSKLTTRLFWAFEALTLTGTVAAAALLSRAQDWQPFAIVGLLLVLSLVGHPLTVMIGGGMMTAAHIALVLAMCLLGPAPAVAFGIAAAILTSGTRRLPAPLWLSNLFSFSVFPLVGSLMARGLAGNVHSVADQTVTKGVAFAFIVFA